MKDISWEGRMVTYEVNSIKKDLLDKGISFVYFQYVDLNGRLYSTTVRTEGLEDAVEGIGIDGYSCGFLDVEKSDLVIKPEFSTLKVLPWQTSTGKVACCLCDIYEPDGRTPFALNPRNILKEAISKMKNELGDSVEFIISPELQFWLMLKENSGVKLYDEGRYFSPPPYDLATDFRQQLSIALSKAGIWTYKSHHETTEGKYELNIGHGSALEIADTMIQYKFIVKNIAAQQGLILSFMPKPFKDRAGNGMHFHQNLIEGDRNLFSAETSKYFGLSSIALNFIAGQLEHARALVALTNPSVNSYKRFHQVKGTEAPCYIFWSQYNRTALIRVPVCGRKNARFEFRGGDGSINPYIGFAGFLIAGLDGIRRKLKPPEPVEENIHSLTHEERNKREIGELPWNLGEALDELEKDDVVKAALGVAYERYISLKRQEWREYGRVVTRWEFDRYIDV